MPPGSNQPARKFSRHKADPALDGLTAVQLLWTAVLRQALADRWAGPDVWHRGAGSNNSRNWWIEGWWIAIADILNIDRGAMQKELVAAYVLPVGWTLPEKPGEAL